MVMCWRRTCLGITVVISVRCQYSSSAHPGLVAVGVSAGEQVVLGKPLQSIASCAVFAAICTIFVLSRPSIQISTLGGCTVWGEEECVALSCVAVGLCSVFPYFVVIINKLLVR